MSYQFDIFTVDTKISQNNSRLFRLGRALQKIKKNSQQIQVKSIQRINKVTLFQVKIPHTNQYTIKLSNDYYAKVNSKTAIQIIQNRIAYIEEQNKKWNMYKNRLVKERDQVRDQREIMERSQSGSKMEVIGENQEGEEVFNIVEFEDGVEGQGLHGKKIEKLDVIKQKQQQYIQESVTQESQKKQQKKPPQQQKKQKQISQNKKIEEVPKQQKIITQKIQEKPKKISKFKADRMKQKQKQ